jgi:hypothetical protein
VSSARLILRPHASHSEAIQPHGLGLGGVLCGRFVLRTLSPVTVTEVWVGRGSVLRARARASNQDSFTRILFLPAVRTTRRTSAPSGWPRRGRLPASRLYSVFIFDYIYDSRGSGVLCLDPPEVKNYEVASEISWNQWSISGGTHRLTVSVRCEQIFTPNM